MKNNNLELPSNRKFGYFFAIVFFGGAVYSWCLGSKNLIIASVVLSFGFAALAFLKDQWLAPLNRFWMYIGAILGGVVSPIVLGLLFFFVFSPIAIVMRITGRDELKLRMIEKPSHWIKREKGLEPQSETFPRQF